MELTSAGSGVCWGKAGVRWTSGSGFHWLEGRVRNEAHSGARKITPIFWYLVLAGEDIQFGK
jgi:hypothetical protein